MKNDMEREPVEIRHENRNPLGFSRTKSRALRSPQSFMAVMILIINLNLVDKLLFAIPALYNGLKRCSEVTKWKRQTAVGLELLAEAGNYAAFQRLYGAPAYGCWYPPQTAGPTAPPSAADLYYRQAAAAAAATLQKPLPYRLYPPTMGLGIPGPSAHLGSLAASSSLSTLSSYYSNQTPEGPSPRSPSPDTPLDPGSPGTNGRRSPSDDEDTIHV
ncbi:hypothetical protein HHI36_012658 [Cryptolaemus montrouzieri]|uniref:Uncharacterized protein n=1 Tax=Cryptolaemus montrouzieri TaxID=559131 RepID=A0ABD2NFW3_9CUCU